MTVFIDNLLGVYISEASDTSSKSYYSLTIDCVVNLSSCMSSMSMEHFQDKLGNYSVISVATASITEGEIAMFKSIINRTHFEDRWFSPKCSSPGTPVKDLTYYGSIERKKPTNHKFRGMRII